MKRLDFGRPAIAGAASDRDLELISGKVLDALDLIELRIDLFSDLDRRYVRTVFEKTKALGKPVIATVRSREEGGGRELRDGERLGLFEAVADLADLIDIEGSSGIFRGVRRIAADSRSILIASYHNFEATPAYSELSVLVRRFRSRGADIVKVATSATGCEDLRSMTRLTLGYWKDGLVTICMGGKGLPTRIFFPIIGSLFTFASIGKPTAPGQVSAVRLRELIDGIYF